MVAFRSKDMETPPTRFEAGYVAHDDDEALRRLGLRRELRKEFTSFSTLSFALGILGYT